MGNARLRQRRGGVRAWTSIRSDIVNSLREDGGAASAVMVDYYGLPRSGERAWPGRDASISLPFEQKASRIREELCNDLVQIMGSNFVKSRFAPYIIMHEFEGLLFSDCAAFGRGIRRPELQEQFQRIRDAFDTPEKINDSPVSAPSKRILELIPNYEKPLLGTLAILEIDLERIRHECPHFDEWLTGLEQLPQLA